MSQLSAWIDSCRFSSCSIMWPSFTPRIPVCGSCYARRASNCSFVSIPDSTCESVYRKTNTTHLRSRLEKRREALSTANTETHRGQAANEHWSGRYQEPRKGRTYTQWYWLCSLLACKYRLIGLRWWMMSNLLVPGTLGPCWRTSRLSRFNLRRRTRRSYSAQRHFFTPRWPFLLRKRPLAGRSDSGITRTCCVWIEEAWFGHNPWGDQSPWVMAKSRLSPGSSRSLQRRVPSNRKRTWASPWTYQSFGKDFSEPPDLHGRGCLPR